MGAKRKGKSDDMEFKFLVYRNRDILKGSPSKTYVLDEGDIVKRNTRGNNIVDFKLKDEILKVMMYVDLGGGSIGGKSYVKHTTDEDAEVCAVGDEDEINHCCRVGKLKEISDVLRIALDIGDDFCYSDERRPSDTARVDVDITYCGSTYRMYLLDGYWNYRNRRGKNRYTKLGMVERMT